MSRDRAKVIFALERNLKESETKLFIFGDHKHGCRIKSTPYWMPEDACTCGWRKEERRLYENLIGDWYEDDERVWEITNREALVF